MVGDVEEEEECDPELSHVLDFVGGRGRGCVGGGLVGVCWVVRFGRGVVGCWSCGCLASHARHWIGVWDWFVVPKILGGLANR